MKCGFTFVDAVVDQYNVNPPVG